MRIPFVHSLGEHPWFWEQRQRLDRWSFLLKRSVFQIRIKIPERGRSISLLFGGLFVIGVSFFALWRLRSVSPIDFWQILLLSKTDAATSLGVLATITSIEGVLIGLHFTVITAAISNIYADASVAVINLITRSKSNLAYISLITLSLLFDLILIALLSVGVSVLQFFFLLALVAAAVSISVLVLIGLQSFNLSSDPTSLVPEPMNRILHWASQAAPKGWLWQDRNFQNHYRRLAETELNSIADLAHFAVKRTQGSREYLSRFGGFLAQLAAYYQRHKRRMPPSSHWFPRKQVTKDWFITSETETQMAMQTHTSLQLKEEPDHFWLEARVKKLVELLLERATEIHGGDPVLAIADPINSLFEILAYNLSVSDALAWIRDYRKQMHEAISNGKFVTSFQKAAITERITLAASSVTIGFFKFVSDTNLENLDARIKKMDLTDPSQFYSLDLPIVLLQKIEKTGAWLEFERDIEGKEVSPNWYTRDLLFHGIALACHSCLELQLKFAEQEHKNLAEALLAEKNAVCASIACTDGLQHTRKIVANLDELKTKAERLFNMSVLKDLPWPTWNWEDYEKRLKKAEKDLLILLARCMPDLPPSQTDERLPDFLGEATHKVGQACFEAMRENDLETFTKTFIPYINGCVASGNRQQMVPGITQEQFLLRRSVSIMDALHLSGYIYLYTELHENPKFWRICKATWDHLLSKGSNLQMIAATIAYHRAQFAILPHGIIRTTWQMQVDRDLSALETHREWGRDGGIGFNETIEVIHPSLFIRAMCGSQRLLGDMVHLFEDGLEIFVSMYMEEHHLGSQLNYGRRRGEIRERIRRWMGGEFGINIRDLRREIFNLTGINEHEED